MTKPTISEAQPMTGLHRTTLTTSQKIECAAAAVARQHEHGSKTALSRAYEVSRPTVYAAGAAAESVLRAHFERRLLEGTAAAAHSIFWEVVRVVRWSPVIGCASEMVGFVTLRSSHA